MQFLLLIRKVIGSEQIEQQKRQLVAIIMMPKSLWLFVLRMVLDQSEFLSS